MKKTICLQSKNTKYIVANNHELFVMRNSVLISHFTDKRDKNVVFKPYFIDFIRISRQKYLKYKLEYKHVIFHMVKTYRIPKIKLIGKLRR